MSKLLHTVWYFTLSQVSYVFVFICISAMLYTTNDMSTPVGPSSPIIPMYVVFINPTLLAVEMEYFTRKYSIHPFIAFFFSTVSGCGTVLFSDWYWMFKSQTLDNLQNDPDAVFTLFIVLIELFIALISFIVGAWFMYKDRLDKPQ